MIKIFNFVGLQIRKKYVRFKINYGFIGVKNHGS